jgi:spermidine/putrescine transport system permease protein
MAVVAGLTYNFLPFMVLPIYASLERVDPRVIEAGGDLFANGFTTFRTVTLPMSMPGVLAGTLLTFIPAPATMSTPNSWGPTAAPKWSAMSSRVSSSRCQVAIPRRLPCPSRSWR